jgi:hypothetical protein
VHQAGHNRRRAAGLFGRDGRLDRRKYRGWSGCDGDLERRWDKDMILTVLTMYGATASIGTPFRQYYDYEKHNTLTSAINVPPR